LRAGWRSIWYVAIAVTRVDVRDEPPARAAPPERARRGRFGRRHRNRRVKVMGGAVARWLEGVVRALGRRLLMAGKGLAVVASLAGVVWGGQRAVRHVIASPRFALREVRIAGTTRATEDELLALAGLRPGDRLLAVNTDAVAARVAAHPWVASARVRRVLPSALAIDVTERHAVASALLGALYLLDATGHPFKRASLEEADGLPVITGIAREQYSSYRAATEAAFREALALLAAYNQTEGGGGSPGGRRRPALSEVHIDPRYGFSLVLFDGGGEIRLGRGGWAGKLARLDEVLGTLGPSGVAAAAMRVVYLDGPSSDRVAVRLTPVAALAPPNHQKISGGDKTR
jgi:cell division protein FtsQ